jgi:hypothetical protein
LATAGPAWVTVIAGREGDIYEMFACRLAETELLIRVQHDRGLEDGSRLFDCTEGLPARVGPRDGGVAGRPGPAGARARAGVAGAPGGDQPAAPEPAR